jgi:hypothetical protein
MYGLLSVFLKLRAKLREKNEKNKESGVFSKIISNFAA